MNRQQTAIAKRAQIIALHDEGLSSRVIAQRLAVSRTTVQKWIHRHEETGNLLDAERRPPPRLTSRAQDEAIQQAVRDDPFTNAVSIRERLRLNQRSHPLPPGPVIYVQDRCPIHTAHAVQEWFRGREDVELLDWQSKGADLNPLENVWANMVNCWEPEMERRPEALMAHTQAQWEMFRNKPNEIRRIVASVPDRLRAVIEKEGGWTGY
ncbi:hypothetical protein Pcinc_000111 [Petrolisthes cinctipes]|uniref:Uncharacterized protein n=1 Tax=Petrolisthes cinctipes TaxID=88211 RepID=A0AAE1GNE3_PETCI|nr:hypothetical protein Pcinc_000111 [Petrolisthes cinctipes]